MFHREKVINNYFNYIDKISSYLNSEKFKFNKIKYNKLFIRLKDIYIINIKLFYINYFLSDTSNKKFKITLSLRVYSL